MLAGNSQQTIANNAEVIILYVVYKAWRGGQWLAYRIA